MHSYMLKRCRKTPGSRQTLASILANCQTPSLQRKVMELIAALKAQGVSVILISHNLHDIFAIADRIVVLRRGEVAGERLVAGTSGDEIVQLMVGDTYSNTGGSGH
jgi:ABC-type sugar transport system ATPase subunit